MGGERGGLPIVGFDLGNSPAEYGTTAVAGKTVILTTTNGTKALLHARAASQVLVGAFVNLSAVCRAVADHPLVDLLCAGTDGQVTSEDVLLAGAIVERLTRQRVIRVVAGGDRARADACLELGRRLGRSVRHADRGPTRKRRRRRNLIAIGMASDIPLAAEIDRFDIAPRYDTSTGLTRCGSRLPVSGWLPRRWRSKLHGLVLLADVSRGNSRSHGHG